MTAATATDFTECPLCRRPYVDPRLLPCFHTFCYRCIIRLMPHGPNVKVAYCPECSEAFPVAPGGPPKNPFADRLMKANSACRQPAPPPLCTACCGDSAPAVGSGKLAASYCQTCKEALCASCDRRHKTSNATRSHRIVLLANVDNGPSSSSRPLSPPSSGCKTHIGQRSLCYCMECCVVACQLCYDSTHQRHACADVDEAADGFREKLTKDARKVAGGIDSCSDVLRKMDTDRTEFIERTDRIRDDVRRHAEWLKQNIDEQSQTLLEKIDTAERDWIEQVQEVRREIENRLAVMNRLKIYTEVLINQGSADDILRDGNSLRCKMKEKLKIESLQRALSNMNSVDIRFIPARNTRRGDGNVVGQIDAQKGACSLSPELKHVSPRGSPIHGLTSLGGQLFVIRNPTGQQLEVYDTETFKLQGYLALDDLDDESIYGPTFGLTSCDFHNCIYVGDCVNSVVYRIEMSGGGASVIHWRTEESPTALTVCTAGRRQHNVLVTCWRSIQEFTSTGSRVRDIQLHADIVSPWCAVLLSTGQVLVSHGALHGGDTPHRLSLLEADGRPTAAYGADKRGSGEGHLDLPAHLVVGEDGSVLLADSSNNRVLVVEPSLAHARQLKLPIAGGLNGPWALHWDVTRGRLFVGESNGGRFLVFNGVFSVSH